jgi:hypothetical protein
MVKTKNAKRKKYRDKRKKANKTRKQKQNQFISLKCSPENTKENGTKKHFTCYTDSDLFRMKEIWNARHPDKPITTNNTEEIWLHLKNFFINSCNKESCWINKLVKGTKFEKELSDSFAPESPNNWKKNPNQWLSSTDILDVMSQYEKAYKCFDFLGPSPIDYDTHKIYGECVWEELCHFSLQDMIKRGKFKIGICFNLDPHYKPGSHWVSMFINIKKGTIFYFDSAGETIPPQIKKFADTVIEQGHHLSKPINFKFDQNHPVEHQYGDTECGVYTLFFIVHMLEDKVTAQYLKTHILSDKYMEKFRKVYFNPDV